jgi:carboxypeptidase Taq
MMSIATAYDELLRRMREEALLSSCAALLAWDEVTFMPRGGAEHRGNQAAYLAGLEHHLAADPRLGELLAIVEGSELTRDLLSAEAVNIRELRRLHDRAVRLPRALVEEIARVTSLAHQEWIGARQDDDFARFRPWLDQVLSLKRAEAAALADGDPYDALLDEYEPGARSAELAVLFDALQRELQRLLEAITASGRQPDAAILHREYPLDRQRVFGETVAAALGFDFQRGRLDTSAHPFCIQIGPGDCRITTRWSRHNFADGFFSILHEVGHALYEQGLAPAHFGTPMGEAPSLGIHESQARLWENLVGRSRPFWRHFYPLAQRVFHEALQDVTLDEFHAAVNRVEPTLNRVQADEVTYNLHILIRFDLERALLAGDLKSDDLPAAWNAAYRRHLGLTPPNDAEGCLQDGHWSSGLIGYFPTYTLGNLAAAQFLARAAEEIGGLDEQWARGDFGGLLAWLREHVHQHGQRFPAARLVEHATGAVPAPRPLLQSLRRKYGELYRLS